MRQSGLLLEPKSNKANEYNCKLVSRKVVGLPGKPTHLGLCLNLRLSKSLQRQCRPYESGHSALSNCLSLCFCLPCTEPSLKVRTVLLAILKSVLAGWPAVVSFATDCSDRIVMRVISKP